MHFLPFLLGVIAHSGLLILSSRGWKPFRYFLFFTVIVCSLVGGVAWFIYSAQGNFGSFPVSLYFIGAAIMVFAVGLFSLPADDYDSTDEATLLQLTIASWYAFFLFSSFIPDWLWIVSALASIFVLLDSFSFVSHSVFMKTFYTLWYALMSVGFLLVVLSMDLFVMLLSFELSPSIAFSPNKVSSIESFACGILIVSSLAAIIRSIILMLSLGVRYDDDPEQLPWPDGYLEHQLPKWLAAFLCAFWVVVYVGNELFQLVSGATLVVCSVAMIKEFSPLRLLVKKQNASSEKVEI